MPTRQTTMVEQMEMLEKENTHLRQQNERLKETIRLMTNRTIKELSELQETSSDPNTTKNTARIIEGLQQVASQGMPFVVLVCEDSKGNVLVEKKTNLMLDDVDASKRITLETGTTKPKTPTKWKKAMVPMKGRAKPKRIAVHLETEKVTVKKERP